MEIGSNGIHLIRHFEGSTNYAYDDVAGVCTVAVGHALRPRRRCTTDDFKKYGSRAEPRMTDAKVEQLLRRDLDIFEEGVAVAIGPRRMKTTRRHEFSAMVCLAFNIGLGAFAKSSVLRLHKSRLGFAAGAAFRLWNKALLNGQLVEVAGLSRRRKSERWLYRKGEFRSFA